VAWLINKVILEYAPVVGSIESEVQRWMTEIEDHVENEIQDLFPHRNGVAPNHYFRAYSIECPSCGERIPISNQWYFNRRKNKAIYPEFDGSGWSFDIIDPSSHSTRDNYDPNQGTVDGGDIECPLCGVVTERSETVEIFKDGEFRFEVCAVRYEKEINGTEYHPPTEEDVNAIRYVFSPS